MTETKTEALKGYDDITLSGNVGDTFSSTDVDTRITALKNAGYEIVTNEFETKDKTIDSTEDVDGQEPSQVYNVVVKETVVDEVETKTITRTIKYVDKENEATAVADTVTQAVELTRTNKRNKVTNVLTEGTWSTAKWEAQTSPTVANYDTPDKENVAETTVTSTTSDTTVVVKYPQTVADEVETKTITRTINYVDELGTKLTYTDNGKETKEPRTDKVTFTREAKINLVTKDITYGEWTAKDNDTTFDAVPSPVVKGYILKADQGSEDGLVTVGGTRVAASTNLTAASENQNLNVVYTKLGSWVPKVPGVETSTPLPYPNHPTDPTKPGEPTDPNVPVIPYVPGYTPKIGETPLVPKVPNDLTQGYIPPVPTEPGKDTPIEYVKVPNIPSPEEPVKPTPESNHITIWVDENGKPLKPEKPGTHEPGNIPGYRYITTVTKDGVTIHKFEKITPVDPNNPVPQKPTTSIPTPQDSTIPTLESQIPTPNTPEANTPTSETNRREELPNTGTEANATLASAGIMTLLAGLGLGFFKKKEEDEK